MNENEFLEKMRAIATHPGARGLADDAALLTFGRHRMVFTHDMLVESVHFLSSAAPADVAWKLLAVNLSDLAAMGARPIGVLMGYSLGGDPEWDEKFANGLKDALERFGVPLLGGDTVALPAGTLRSLSMTAIGEAKGHLVPSRSGAEPGDFLYVSGPLGDGWAGLQIATETIHPTDMLARDRLLAAYNRPQPMLAAGRALSSLVSAMMDISDGLLIDADRIARASGLGIEISLDRIPLSPEFEAVVGRDRAARMLAATAGDDYQLLFTARTATVLPVPATRIGRCVPGAGLRLHDGAEPVPLPDRLGYIHAQAKAS
ncbi:MAG: thiamine-phosphate kinase [Parasphingorhabdus sp.]|nr:thiamine-phosphate kinase [Parasphingorhabdus sp.]